MQLNGVCNKTSLIILRKVNKMTMKLFAAVLVGVLSVGCVNNHVALLEAHSIGSQYREGSLKKVGEGTYFGNPKYDYIKYESPRSYENDSFTVCTNPQGKIIAINGDKVCGSKEDAEKMATELLERLKNQYQDRLKDCGAKKSELVLEIWTENDTAVFYSLKAANP